MIEARELGGTCALRGCDPKKILADAAARVLYNNDRGGQGVEGELTINWKELQTFKNSFTDPIPETTRRKLEELKIDIYQDEATCSGRDTIQAGNVTLKGEKIVLANGLVPAPLDVEGEEHLAHSDDFLYLDKLPRSIIFIGGGYIAFEFATIAHAARAEVTIIDSSQVLDGFSRHCVSALASDYQERGIQILQNCKLNSIKKVNEQYHVSAQGEDGEKQLIADLVVHAAGRVPALQGLALDKAGVKTSKKGVVVDVNGRSTSNPTFYAIGDIADNGLLPLTPAAGWSAKKLIASLKDEKDEEPWPQVLPTVVFTHPPMASVGKKEDEVEGDENYQVVQGKGKDWYNANRLGSKLYHFSIIIEKESNRVVGATLLLPHADEVINILAIANEKGVTTPEFKKLMFTYPTVSSDLGYMVEGVMVEN